MRGAINEYLGRHGLHDRTRLAGRVRRRRHDGRGGFPGAHGSAAGAPAGRWGGGAAPQRLGPARPRPAGAAGTTGMLTAGRDWLSRRPRVPRIPRLPGALRVSEIPKQSGVSGPPEVSGARTLGADALEPGAFEAGAFGPSPFGAGPFAPGAERMAQPDEPGSYSDTGWHLTGGDERRGAGSRRGRAP